MPTYDYFCEKCQNTIEYFQSMSDSALEKCPKCNNKVRRLISGGSGLIFKGSGFYLTDYAQKKENKPTIENKKKTDKKKPKEKNKKK
tara:strand:+ start:191 stop:451 length:261 start_codon:yes stop_codon:yes gene_type:complete